MVYVVIDVDVQAQGFMPRSKSLEEVLKSSCKLEGKLIGYDEIPVDVTAINTNGTIIVKQNPCRNFNRSIRPIREVLNICSPCALPANQRHQSSFGTIVEQLDEDFKNHDHDMDSEKTGCSEKRTARSRLYEFCAANCWKPPSFECCKEEGPSHLKLFTFKVTLEIEEASEEILECVGEAQAKKKDAAENAAEGALWYLQHVYLPNGN